MFKKAPLHLYCVHKSSSDGGSSDLPVWEAGRGVSSVWIPGLIVRNVEAFPLASMAEASLGKAPFSLSSLGATVLLLTTSCVRVNWWVKCREAACFSPQSNKKDQTIRLQASHWIISIYTLSIVPCVWALTSGCSFDKEQQWLFYPV